MSLDCPSLPWYIPAKSDQDEKVNCLRGIVELGDEEDH